MWMYDCFELIAQRFPGSRVSADGFDEGCEIIDPGCEGAMRISAGHLLPILYQLRLQARGCGRHSQLAESPRSCQAKLLLLALDMRIVKLAEVPFHL
jgi:hypothetical protein